MDSKAIRNTFLEFFKSKGHEIYPSSSLVPDDPTMLLTTAGMVQFKPYFEGALKPKHRRITTSQKCARTTDIDRVGHTARHLTFFEMLGNFSLGDYYKKEAINWAWELLTKHYELDKNKLWATIFTDDEEAYDIWNKDVDIDNSRIARLGEEHNFWSAGDVGPCGPSSEIIYDFGEEHACGPDCKIGCDCDRWLEIWNLVFMQYERCEDTSLKELPSKNIDTGMGLERIASILQKVPDNFQTDLLKPILESVSSICGVKLGDSPKKDVSLKIITDHSRAVAFLIADGVIPANEGRGYVLRRLIRRSIRHGWLLGIEKPFMEKPLNKAIKLMGDIYHELITNKDYILKIVATEEEKFGRTLRQGLEMISEQVEQLKKSKKKELSSDLVFKLHDTYGFPVELTAEIAAENKLSLNMDKFDELMRDQKKRARAAWKEEEKEFTSLYNKVLEKAGITQFIGYEELESESVIKALVVDHAMVDTVKAGAEVEIFLDKTPFYAEKGGQVTDKGLITKPKVEVDVYDVKEGLAEFVVHKAKVAKGSIKVGDKVYAAVDKQRRLAITRAHTATHLLHWALRSLFGTHIKQGGSLVEEDRLRFDFTHFEALTDKQIKQVEDLVNEKILSTVPVRSFTTTIDFAKEIQAIAFFGEKYGEFVRVVEAGDFSKELCGGTHVSNTALINLFKIASEGSVGANLRRIEAFTGAKLFKQLREDEEIIKSASASLKVTTTALIPKIESVNKEVGVLRKELEKAKKGGTSKEIEKMSALATKVNGLSVVAHKIENADIATLRNYADNLRNKLPNSTVMLASQKDGKVLILAAASKKVVDQGFDANAWLKEVLPLIKGSGGGKPQLAQAGGTKPDAIPKALDKALEYVKTWSKKH